MKELASAHKRMSFSFVHRGGNKAAHWLTYHQKIARIPLDWRSNVPPVLVQVLAADCSPSGID